MWIQLQVEHPEGAEFDSSDTSVYFVKSGQVQLKAADKQLQDREAKQTVAQAAVAVQTMAATGPLSKVHGLCLPVTCLHVLSIGLSVCQYVFLSVCLSVCLFVCLSAAQHAPQDL